MSLHLIKLAVGVETVPDLRERQAQRLRADPGGGDQQVVPIVTRNRPRRMDELLDGGSLYWVIKGMVQVRQRIVGVDSTDGDGVVRCVLFLDPTLVPTELRPHRPFQGWRYLEDKAAPQDNEGGWEAGQVLNDMAAELIMLGLK